MYVNKAQILAADPSISAWVSASAGTGKTRILTNRVLRLLLDGGMPSKILCLTFTKAAAKEMENRINENLLLWQNLEIPELINSLGEIFGRAPTREEIATAPNLFKSQINSVLPIKIQTIHSFCQFILDKFPLEAKVAPGFKVIDEFKSAEIINNIRIDIISNHHRHDKELSDAIEFIAGNFHDMRMSALIEKILQDKVKFLDLFKQYDSVNAYRHALEEEFLGGNDKKKELHLNIISTIGAEEKDLAKLEKYNELANSCNFIVRFEDINQELLTFFLTLENEPRKTLLSKKWVANHPEKHERLLAIQGFLWERVQREKARNLIIYSSHLFVIAKYILGDYEYYKRIYGYLDYDDLIIKTRDLLINSDVKEWVIYKLDGGLDHILLDEAQDTSKEQWEIIEAIASEFYSGVTRSDSSRTLFVVGDEKQSIYSFQGADPECYRIMNEYFAKRMFAAQKIYKNIDLEISYRSVREINEFVAQNFAADFPSASVITSRSEDAGSVELWPAIFDESEEVESWPLPLLKDSRASYEKLAAKIADYIGSLVIDGMPLFTPGDFLILVRKRSDFVNSLIKHLEERKIKVAGIDRMKIMENMVSLDILSLAKFVLLPEDDLNLAGFLKSPFIGLSENELLDLCVSRVDVSLYASLPEELLQKLSFFQKKYMQTSLSSFFFEILEIDAFREKLLACHGVMANDIINEFLDLAYSFEKNEQNSLQNFVFWLENAKIELKRDLESSDAVRIMTIHGSKGLQSKVVIVVDSSSSRSPSSIFLWHEKGYCLFPGGSANYIQEYERLLDVKKQKDYEEYMRLRYVGLTRAEDHLVIASYD
jgi:ATP-dependent helicase/nuclease subunit A